MSSLNDAYIIGVSQFNTKKFTALNPPKSVVDISSELLQNALSDASPYFSTLNKSKIDGLFAMRPLFPDNSTKHSPEQHKYPLWLADELGLGSST